MAIKLTDEKKISGEEIYNELLPGLQALILGATNAPASPQQKAEALQMMGSLIFGTMARQFMAAQPMIGEDLAPVARSIFNQMIEEFERMDLHRRAGRGRPS